MSTPEPQLYCPICRATFEGVKECPKHRVRLLPVDRSSKERIGTVVAGKFYIESVLGGGSMGTVFKAVQHPIERTVAVKVLHPDLAQDATFESRFFTEAQASSALQNPNTITVHDFGQTEDGSLYLAMEYLEGFSLARRLTRGPLPVQQSLEIGSQICRALSEAHRKGIVHRDLKPDNIMLTAADDGSLLVKVVDFGIAKLLGTLSRERPGKAPVSQSDVIIGTPHYMAPEQTLSSEPSPFWDLYALGVILHEMLSGQPPFDHANPLEVLAMHLEKDPPALVSPLEPIPAPLASLVAELLAKKPTERPEDADSVRRVLRELIEIKSFTAESVIGGLEEVRSDSSDPDDATQPFRPTRELFVSIQERDDGAQPIPGFGGIGRLPLLASIGLGIVLVFGVVVMLLLTFDFGGSDARQMPSARGGRLGPTPDDMAEEFVDVTIKSTPSGAKVFRGAELLCTTPCLRSLPKGKRFTLRFQLEDHVTQARLIEPGEDQEILVELLARPRVSL